MVLYYGSKRLGYTQEEEEEEEVVGERVVFFSTRHTWTPKISLLKLRLSINLHACGVMNGVYS